MGKQKLPQTFQFPGYNYNACTIPVLELMWILLLVWTEFFSPKIKKKVLFLNVLVYCTTDFPTKVKHKSVQGPAKYGVDDQAMPSHQESCEEKPDLPMCYLFINLYQQISSDGYDDEGTGPYWN